MPARTAATPARRAASRRPNLLTGTTRSRTRWRLRGGRGRLFGEAFEPRELRCASRRCSGAGARRPTARRRKDRRRLARHRQAPPRGHARRRGGRSHAARIPDSRTARQRAGPRVVAQRPARSGLEHRLRGLPAQRRSAHQPPAPEDRARPQEPALRADRARRRLQTQRRAMKTQPTLSPRLNFILGLLALLVAPAAFAFAHPLAGSPQQQGVETAGTETEITLRWEARPRVSRYRVQIASDPRLRVHRLRRCVTGLDRRDGPRPASTSGASRHARRNGPLLPREPIELRPAARAWPSEPDAQPSADAAPTETTATTGHNEDGRDTAATRPRRL